jgi:aminoglycoside/choline kinase family phosphotransferase
MMEDFTSLEKSTSEQEIYPSLLELNNTEFSLQRIRDYGQGAIYKNDSVYARVASPDVLKKEYETHLFFNKLGFPIPKLLGNGSVGNLDFYLEENIGIDSFHDSFKLDVAEQGVIKDEIFEEFISIVRQFSEAQVQATTNEGISLDSSFFENAYFNEVAKESEDFAKVKEEVERKLLEHIGSLPQAPTHGDFNPYNVLPKGVIDFAYHFQGPIGYDWAALIMNTHYFSDAEKIKTEMNRVYTYTNTQLESLLTLFDDLYKKMGIEISFREALPYLALVRMVWSAAHMQHRPALQQWRFEKLQKANQQLLLSESGEEMLKTLKD